MRGRKRLRKKMCVRKPLPQKMNNKETGKDIFDVNLEFGAALKEDASNCIVEQFKKECLKPVNLLYNVEPTDSGCNGTIENPKGFELTEEHRGLIADWAFQQEEINSYCVGQLTKR